MALVKVSIYINEETLTVKEYKYDQIDKKLTFKQYLNVSFLLLKASILLQRV